MIEGGQETKLDFKTKVLETILEDSTQAMAIFDLNTLKYVYINSQQEEMFKCSAEEIIKLGATHFLPTLQPDGRSSIELLEEFVKTVSTKGEVKRRVEQNDVLGNKFMIDISIKRIKAPFDRYAIATRTKISDLENERIKIEEIKRTNSFLFENTFDGFIIFDGRLNRPVDCNQKFLDYLQITKEEFLSKKPIDLSPKIQSNGTDSKKYRMDLLEKIKSSGNLRYNWTHLRSDGTALDTEVSTYTLDPPNDHLRISILKDITQELEKLKAIRNQENTLREAQRMTKMASFRYNEDEDVLTWTHQDKNLIDTEFSSAPTSIQPYIKMIHQEDQERFVEELTKTSETLFPLETEFRAQLQDGSTIYVKFKAKHDLESNGSVFIGTIQNITEQKIIENKLLGSTAQYEDLFNNMYDALLILDKNGYFVNSNLAAQKLLGYSGEELKQVCVKDIVHPDDQEKSKLYLDKLVKDGFYSDYKGRIIRKDGQVRYLQVNSNAIMENGEMIGSRDIARDITVLQGLDDKKHKLFEQIQIANQELKDFAHVVSHDLKAPLRAISSLANWIKEDYIQSLDDKGEELLNLLVDRVGRMHNFIEGILEYTRVGSTTIKQENFSIHETIEEILDSLEIPSFVKISIPEPLPNYFGDKLRIMQIFQNLISNAIKYGDQKNGAISIYFKENSDHIQFTIEDNGPGIDPKYFEKIFQIFQTLQARDRFESTGIGLTIVNKIIQQLGGKIWIESELNKGSKFHFTLPKSSISE